MPIRNSFLTRFKEVRPATAARRSFGSGETIRYALIGGGSAARSHLADITAKANVVFVGVADPAPVTSLRIGALPDGARHFASAQEMLRKQRPDVVSVCTPPCFHHRAVLEAFAAGAHVICEKPLALNLREAEEMERVRVASGLSGAINFSYRNTAAFRYAKRRVESGLLGKLIRVHVVYLQSFMLASETRWGWRHDEKTAGFGALGDLGVHMIDAVRFITGTEFCDVMGQVQTVPAEKPGKSGRMQTISTDTHAVLMAKLGNGALALLETAQVAAGYGNYFRIEISGEKGTLVVDTEHPLEFRSSAEGGVGAKAIWRTELPSLPVPAEFLAEPYTPSPGALIDALRGTNTSYPTFADGVAAQQVLAALKQSIRSGRWGAVGRRNGLFR